MLFSNAISALSLMPIISARGINAHVTYQRDFVSFYEGRRARNVVGQQPIYSSCIHACPWTNSSSTFTFAIVGSRWDPPKKLLGWS
jgi:hypothetical protein